MSKSCQTCGRLMHPAKPGEPSRPDTDCGGDCLACMANAGDRDCQRALSIAYHGDFDKVCINKDTDFEPYGKRDRDKDYGPDCSCGCKFFQPTQTMPADWGVCVNPESPRAGLLTFEHQGCKHFRSSDNEM